MISLAKLSIRRPRTMLAVWLLVAAVLTLFGLGVSKAPSPTVTVVPGGQSARAEKLAGATGAGLVMLAALLGRFGWWPTAPARPSRAGARMADTETAPPTPRIPCRVLGGPDGTDRNRT